VHRLSHLTKLLRGGNFRGAKVRFQNAENRSSPVSPVVVWHMTDACNLKCRHCYASGSEAGAPMSRVESLVFLEHLAALKPAALLLSGGEPLTRPDFFELLEFAVSLNLKVSLSTNGTLIDDRVAALLKDKGVGYVGVSLDGAEGTHDAFRGAKNAFAGAMAGIEALKNKKVRTGLRFTMARPLLPELTDVMKIGLAVDRVCFYHFIPSGRGRSETDLFPSRSEVRSALMTLFDWVDSGAPEEVLTVGNFSDGLFLYLLLKERGDGRAENVTALLARGGGLSGRGIVSLRWDGALFPDQFSWSEARSLGHWKDIGKIFTAPAIETSPLRGRCGRCRWISLCRGGMRARAEAMTGDPAGEDPGCVLEDAEISRTEPY
jgi:radical SAM protein with 4Fe4S-binding SPASM domain